MSVKVLDGRDLAGRVCLVVGAQRGIGFACAQAYASAGGTVAAADLAGSKIREAVERLVGSRHSAHHVDVADQGSVSALVQEVLARHGRIDVLLNAAAILEVSPFLEVSLESWERTLATNLTGTFLVGQAVARQMVNQRSGRIILIASNVGRIPRINNTAYAASKAGVIHLVRSMALEISKYGITVNALCPGSTATEMLVDIQAKGDPQRLEGIIKGSVEQWRTGIPLGRLAKPEDQAAMALFLASEAGGYVNGQALCVDGGQTLF